MPSPTPILNSSVIVRVRYFASVALACERSSSNTAILRFVERDPEICDNLRRLAKTKSIVKGWEKNVYEEDGRWYFDGEVRDIKGIGRFVMGLAAEVEILEGEDLRRYVSEACADAAVKFRPTAVPGSRG